LPTVRELELKKYPSSSQRRGEEHAAAAAAAAISKTTTDKQTNKQTHPIYSSGVL
jgi:hypothetical protein